MTTLLEIAGDDIALLDDDDLRELIGLLCEADYRLVGLPTRGIQWGGHQDAIDGGLDVIVRDTVTPPENSFVRRSITGFQIKKTDIIPSQILREIRPNGVLRPAIKDLIKDNGAYVIVSSNASVTNTALDNRIDAMKEAIANEVDHENLHLDFLDRGRIATWVRSYPSLILWVRNKINKPLKAWRSYENWSNAPGGLEEEYLLDDGLRLYDCETHTKVGQSVTEGLSRIRTALATPGMSVRLTGLSGVGKTRFAQALFDIRIGKRALNPSQVVYADVSDGPDPDPVTLSSQLINDRSPVVLIVDNCPPDLHHRLTQTCSQARSTVSLLTVEYDVRDDIPEEKTSVFRLEPASDDLIEKLVLNRFQHIGQVNALKIAEFSGGNARVAIALANTVKHGETLSGFRNEVLFERLFQQRHQSNASLLDSAQVCSLVYSFEGTDVTAEDSELKFLGSLVQKSAHDLFRDVTKLKQRELIQSRDVWRAILPHAIANRLAKQALESIPKQTIVSGFLTNSSERLIKSFTRRLSYLHDSEVAKNIVEEWLEPEGWIGKSIENLSQFGVDVFMNIAPVSPEATLSAVERAANGSSGITFTSRMNSHHTMFVRLLRHLAYAPDLFDRSVNLIIRFAATEDPNENVDPIRDVLKSLFYIHLSGTQAPIEARADIVQVLLDSDKAIEQDLGLLILDAALETWHFSASHEFGFGARPRDFGYYPKTREDKVHWLSTFSDICTRLALSDRPVSEQARQLLANKLRGLWTKGGMFTAIEKTVDKLLEQGAWNNGWIAIRGIIRYDSKKFDEETRKRLLALEKRLKPVDLLEKARTFALSNQRGSFDLEGAPDDNEPVSASYLRTEKATRAIGAEVATNSETFKELLPDLVSTYNTRLHNFGQGLANGCADKNQMFRELRNALEYTPHDKRQIGVILGFLSSTAESDPEFYDTKLDEAVGDGLLGEWFPILQKTSKIDQRGVERLHESLDLGKAPLHTYEYLAGRVYESISDDDLAGLIEKILTKEGSVGVAIEMLQMKFYPSEGESREYSDALIELAQKTLTKYRFDQKQQQLGNEDYNNLSDIAQKCLGNFEGISVAKELTKNLADAILKYQISSFNYTMLLNTIAKLQPKIFLDEFLGREDVEEYQLHRLLSGYFERGENPMSQISDDTVIAWCEEEPKSRYSIVVSTVNGFEKPNETGKYEWRPVITTILDRAPDLEKVFEALGQSLRPSFWSGSLANILEERSVLLRDLYDHQNVEVASWARSYFARFQRDIASERKWEQKNDRPRNESFE